MSDIGFRRQLTRFGSRASHFAVTHNVLLNVLLNGRLWFAAILRLLRRLLNRGS